MVRRARFHPCIARSACEHEPCRADNRSDAVRRCWRRTWRRTLHERCDVDPLWLEMQWPGAPAVPFTLLDVLRLTC